MLSKAWPAQPDAKQQVTTTQTHKLRLALYLPETPRPARDSSKWWLTEIAKRSRGTLQITGFRGEGLLKGSEIISGVQTGVTDMGFTFRGPNMK